MENIILYELEQSSQYSLNRFVSDYGEWETDDSQGVIFKEYDEHFLRALYWQKKKYKKNQYNLVTQEFEEITEEMIGVAEFLLQVDERKLLIFGNKMMAQKIITLLGIVSRYSYSITEYIIDIKKLINRLCSDELIIFQKMKLTDISIDNSILVDCNVNLANLDNPKEAVKRYQKNIVVISFKLNPTATNFIVYKTGKISLGKIAEDEKDEVLRQLLKIVC